jgi:ubiquinone/menaquinone biosynthesis C-methylase UbiE
MGDLPPFFSLKIQDSGVIEGSQAGPVQILDNACGTGVVTELVFAKLKKDSFTLVATDIAPPMINIIQGKISNNGWDGQATAHIADMQVCI